MLGQRWPPVYHYGNSGLGRNTFRRFEANCGTIEEEFLSCRRGTDSSVAHLRPERSQLGCLLNRRRFGTENRAPSYHTKVNAARVGPPGSTTLSRAMSPTQESFLVPPLAH